MTTNQHYNTDHVSPLSLVVCVLSKEHVKMTLVVRTGGRGMLEIGAREENAAITVRCDNRATLSALGELHAAVSGG